jgi:hypothetical protein
MDPRLIDLCKETYNQIIKDKVITEEEWVYLGDLHRLVFNYIEPNRVKILKDIEDIVKPKRIVYRR